MSEITYKSLKNMRALRDLPILTLDQRWYQLMPDTSKTDEIKYWEKRVNDLLKKQGQVSNDIKDIDDIKKKLMDGVVQNMEEEDSKKHRKRMSQSQRLILEARDKIEALTSESEDIPRLLQEANVRLLVETVKVCYDKINDNTMELEVLDKWIEATRIKLKKNLLVRQDKEDMNNKLYSGMHSILGAEIMSAIDRINDGEEF